MVQALELLYALGGKRPGCQQGGALNVSVYVSVRSVLTSSSRPESCLQNKSLLSQAIKKKTRNKWNYFLSRARLGYLQRGAVPQLQD